MLLRQRRLAQLPHFFQPPYFGGLLHLLLALALLLACRLVGTELLLVLFHKCASKERECASRIPCQVCDQSTWFSLVLQGIPKLELLIFMCLLSSEVDSWQRGEGQPRILTNGLLYPQLHVAEHCYGLDPGLHQLIGQRLGIGTTVVSNVRCGLVSSTSHFDGHVCTANEGRPVEL